MTVAALSLLAWFIIVSLLMCCIFPNLKLLPDYILKSKAQFAFTMCAAFFGKFERKQSVC